MKKAVCLSLFSLFFIALIYSSRYIPFKQVDSNVLEATLHNYDMSGMVEILNYDPCITVYPATGHTVSTDQVTVYVHGWGESQQSIPFLKANSSLLPEAVIGFNFQDAIADSAKFPYLSKTNFCQTDDIASLVMVLKVLDENQITVFHLFGTDRGAGTIVTAVARLMHYNSYKVFFKRLNIGKEQAQRILKKIKAGTIVLNRPLIDINESFKHKLAPYGVGWLSPLLTYGILPCLTNYSLMHDSPIKAAKYMQKLDIPLLVHFQKDDLILGNSVDADFYEKIKGEHSYLILGNDGGHSHKGETLALAVHAFRKKYNGPYLLDDEIINSGNALLAEASFCTSNSAQYIHDFYAQNTYVFKPKKDVTWQQAFADFDMSSIRSTLGYDPNIRIYQSDSRVEGSSVVVYVHGYGDNYQFTVPHFQMNSYLLPGTVVSFNFQDVTEGAFKVKINKSSVGQSADIASLVMVLKVLDECGLDVVHLFGYSRGGATIVTTLGRLCAYQKHREFFNRLGITQEQICRIISKIKAGTIVLNCPLVDSKSVAHHWFGSLDKMVMNTLLPKIMEHCADEDQAVDAASVIQPHHFKVLVHFQKNDTILGNTLIDATFYNNLKGPHTYLVIADEGGHFHAATTLNKVVQGFRKKYDGAHYPIERFLEEANVLLKASPITDVEVKNYVARMYK